MPADEVTMVETTGKLKSIIENPEKYL